jgi:hypothetical protein
MSIPSMSDSKDRVVAKPSGMCCLKGFLHQGEPRGSYEDIADIPSYVSKPNSSRSNGHILLYFPDVFGFFPNGMLIMDAFAEAGYLVVGLDYFRGVWESGAPGRLNFTADSLSLTRKGPGLEAHKGSLSTSHVSGL